MRSPRSRRPSRSDRRRGPGAALLALLGLAVAGCASAPAPPPSAGAAERPYLVSPLLGYPRALAADLARELQTLHRAVAEGRNLAGARAALGDLLAADPGLEPARVVLAQADLVERRFDAALAALAPIARELPGYTAARLIEGAAAEATGDLPRAYDAFLAAAPSSVRAAERAAELLPRTVEILATRVGEELARGRVDGARDSLERLLAWAPEEPATLRAAWRVAGAEGDAAGELAALRRLMAAGPEERELVERRGELEVEVGEAGVGLELLQRLAERHPDDAELAGKLARAKFAWRLVLLPPKAREVVEQPQLDRSQFAALLYWLFPPVRYDRAQGGTIANDVFQHPFREEIVRVVNLGLLRVDPRLHRFEPDRPLSRGEAITALLTLLERQRPPLSCLGRGDGGGDAGNGCQRAARCGLIASVDDCLAGGRVSGKEAADMARRALANLGLE